MGASLPAKDSARQGMKASRNTIADSFLSASGLRPRQARNKITTFEMFPVPYKFFVKEYQGSGAGCSVPFWVNPPCHVNVGDILERDT